MSIPTIRQPANNVAYNFSYAQVKVIEATSNVPWGPSIEERVEIADLTHNPMAFTEIMSIIWKRLNESGKNWHVYKSLVLLNSLIKGGNEKVAQQCRENVFTIETLKDFQYVEYNRDQGLCVRELAKYIISMLSDDELLKMERTRFLLALNTYKNTSPGAVGTESYSRRNRHHVTGAALDPEYEEARPSTVTEEKMQLQIALALPREEQKKISYKYLEAQVKVEEATRNDPWGPSTALMSEIADLTHNPMAFSEIMSIIWKRLNDSGKNWRHIYKSLVLLNFLIKCGNEKVVQHCREIVYTFEHLQRFHILEGYRDQGLSVREIAKDIISLLSDDQRLKSVRAQFILALNKFKYSSTGVVGAESSSRRNGHHVTDAALDPEYEEARPSTVTEEEMQIRIALALSRKEHETADKMRKSDEVGLLALEESKKEAEQRRIRQLKSSTLNEMAELKRNQFRAFLKQEKMRAAQGQAPPVSTMAPRGGLPQPVANPFANPF